MYYRISTLEWKVRVLNRAVTGVASADAKIDAFAQSVNNLINVMGNNIMIDDKVAYSEKMETAKSNAENASVVLTNSVIPSIYSSISSLQSEISYLYACIREEEERKRKKDD